MKTFGSFGITVDVHGLDADAGCQVIQDEINSVEGFDVHVGPHYTGGTHSVPLGVCVSGRVFKHSNCAGAMLAGDVTAEYVPLHRDEHWRGKAVVKIRWSHPSSLAETGM